MPPPRIFPDVEPGPEREGRRPAWWRRALAFVLRGMNRRLGGAGNPDGAGRDLLPDRLRRGRLA